MNKEKTNRVTKTNLAMCFRQWTRNLLRPEDYAFAVSEKPGEWLSPSHTWPRDLVAECVRWEMRREYANCKLEPFIKARQARIVSINQATVIAPRMLKNLNEVIDFSKAVEAIANQPKFPASSFHVLEIEHFENTEITVQRFRNWLTSKNKSRRKPEALIDDGRTPDFDFSGRLVTTSNGATALIHAGSPGRKDYKRALLRAIAIRRLRQAGLTRRETAEQCLKINDCLLGEDQWQNLPRKADEAIRENRRLRRKLQKIRRNSID